MHETIAKWGNSLAVRIPTAMAEQLHWKEDTEVTCTLVGGTLVIAPTQVPVYDLDALVAGITDDNLHGEMLTGPAVGEESW